MAEKEGSFSSTSATLWALKEQVKRDLENGTAQEHLVPYSVVLAYAEQAVDEEVEPLRAKIRRQYYIMWFTRGIGAFASFAAGWVLALSI